VRATAWVCSVTSVGLTLSRAYPLSLNPKPRIQRYAYFIVRYGMIRIIRISTYDTRCMIHVHDTCIIRIIRMYHTDIRMTDIRIIRMIQYGHDCHDCQWSGLSVVSPRSARRDGAHGSRCQRAFHHHASGGRERSKSSQGVQVLALQLAAVQVNVELSAGRASLWDQFNR
jgi:hypothetical protein